jgi:hypothetical protein
MPTFNASNVDRGPMAIGGGEHAKLWDGQLKQAIESSGIHRLECPAPHNFACSRAHPTADSRGLARQPTKPRGLDRTPCPVRSFRKHEAPAECGLSIQHFKLFTFETAPHGCLLHDTRHARKGVVSRDIV